MNNDCGFTKDNQWFRYRAAAIIVEDDCVLFAGNDREDYLYSVGGAVHLGETAEDAVRREVLEETGVSYEINRLAVIHENFFNESNGSLKGLTCHEISFYFLMKPRGTQDLQSNSTTLGVREEMHWIPFCELDKHKAFPSFLKDYLHRNPGEIEHIVTDERKHKVIYMKEIDISRFSPRYDIRRMTLDDTDAVFDLLVENQPYFLCCGSQPTKELVHSDITVGPPGIPAAQKYYLGFYRDNTLLAVMDLIDGYPEDQYAFIGFFMLRLSLQGAGEGSRLICEIIDYLQKLGFAAVRLGIDKNNANGVRFWTKNGFEIIKEIEKEDGIILYAERKI